MGKKLSNVWNDRGEFILNDPNQVTVTRLNVVFLYCQKCRLGCHVTRAGVV